MQSPAASSIQSPDRFWALDALRGICALSVFLTHWHLWSNFAPQGTVPRFVRHCAETAYDWFVILVWPTGGHHPAVICFFALSGFCIHYPFALRAKSGGEPDWRSYFHRRFRRIMPIYWLATLLGLLFVAAQHWRPAGNELLQFHAMAEPLGVAVRILGLEGLYTGEIVAGNYILITVAAEMVMYVVYPLIYRPATRNAWLALGAGFVGLQLLGLVLLKYVTPYWVFNSILTLGLFWYAGAFAAHRFVAGRAALHPAWLLVSWVGFLVLKSIPHFYGLNLLKQVAWGVVCTCVILLVVRNRPDRGPAKHSPAIVRILCWLGGISYSLYALHTPLIMLATWLLVTFAPSAGYLSQVGLAFTLTALVVPAAHYGVERRFYPTIAAAVRS